MNKTLGDCFRAADLPQSEICYILREITGKNTTEILAQKSTQLSEKDWANFERVVTIRKTGKPLQYIFGRVYFYDRELAVDESVLIPRPETELLVEKIIAENRSRQNLQILDIGTGSGCIAICLAKNLDCKSVDAVDAHSLAIAAQNAKTHKAKINFFASDIFSQVTKKYDVIVSNPPYISGQEFGSLEKQVKDFEPKTALVAKENGTYFYKKILTDLNRFLSYKGRLYLEIGAEQAAFITSLAKEQNFRCQIEKDLNGFDRIAVIQCEI